MPEGDRPPSPADANTREQSPADVERQTPASTFAPGDPLPNLEMWVLVRKLGGGGFGEVWLARHEWRGLAAVKFCTDPKARHQLVTHERTVVARVMKHGGKHPNIVPLLECNLSGDIPWLMYEYVEGGTLAEAVAEWHSLSPPKRLGRAVRVLHAITGALGMFHRLNPPLIHRDLKPQNVLMAGSTPRITDFGIGGAALEVIRSEKNDPGSALAVEVPAILQNAGTSRYAPPEQRFGSPPSPRDDVYALGVLAYQLIRADLEADPGPDAARELRAMRIPSELTSLIASSLALDPDRRPKDASVWETHLATLIQKKTAARKPMPKPAEADNDAPTEEVSALSESEVTSALVSQMLTVAARGRWYTRPAGKPEAEWQFVITTPAEVRVSPGEVYRFSINSAATEENVQAIRMLVGLTSLRYLNLSYCAGVTDAALAHLKGFPGLRQLFLRGCQHITDAGLQQLHALADLETLELTDCPHVTANAVATLQAALPKCKILR